MKLKPPRGTHQSKPLEDHDYVTHNVEPHQHRDGHDNSEEESLELKETDETQAEKDKDYYFMDTTLIGRLINCEGSCISLINCSW